MRQEHLVCALLQPRCAGELYEELKNRPCLVSSSKENIRINTTKNNKNIQLVFLAVFHVTFTNVQNLSA